MESDFLPVTRKKWKFRSKLKIKNKDYIMSESAADVDTDIETLLNLIDKVSAKIIKSRYFKGSIEKIEAALSMLEHPDNPKRIICLGVGHFSHGCSGLHQLAFILGVKEHFEAEAVFYDPIHTANEIEALTQKNCKVMDFNAMGHIEADVLTIFYMPHCPHLLANNLLYRNFSPTALPNLILINNSINKILTDTIASQLDFSSKYMDKVSEYMLEVPLDDKYDKVTFNDLSVHIFPKYNLPAEDDEYWIRDDEKATIDSDNDITESMQNITI